MSHRMPHRTMARALRQLVSGMLVYVLVTTGCWAQNTQVLNGEQTFVDSVGVPLAGGTVKFYVPNTSTLKATYKDAAGSMLNTNPVVLDSAGRAIIWGSGTYRQVVKDASGNSIWDQVTGSVGSGGGGNTASGSLAVGTLLPFSGFTAPPGWVFAYGQALSRTTYPDLFSALTQVQTGICVSGSPTIGGLTSTAQMRVGARIEAACLAPGTVVLSITNINTLVASTNATTSLSTAFTIFAWGDGDGALTFNVPDLRGRVLPGADAMGGTAAGNLTFAYYGAVPLSPGQPGGLQSNTLEQGNLPTVNFVVASGIPVTVTDTRTWGLSLPSFVAGNTAGSANVAIESSSPTDANITSGVISSTGGSITAATSGTGTAASGGADTPFSIVPPSLTINYIIKVVAGVDSGAVVSIGGMGGIITCSLPVSCTGQNIGGDVLDLPQNFAPNATADMLLLQRADGVFYKVNPATIAAASTSGVSSLGGRTGALSSYVPSVLDYGAACDGTTDDTTKLQAAINGAGAVLSWPGSLCGVGAGGISGVSNQTWQSSGKGVSGVRLLVNPTGDTVSFIGKSNFAIQDFTIDYNNKTPVSGLLAALSINNSTDFAVRRIAILHGNLFGLSINTGVRFWVEDNYFQRDAIALTQNEAFNINNSFGENNYGHIRGNTTINWGWNFGGVHNTVVSENVIDGWGFGGGMGQGGPGYTDDTTIYANNIITDGSTSLDSNSLRPQGMELYPAKAVVTGNLVYSNGGGGIRIGGQYNVVANNSTFNNGKRHSIDGSFVAGGLESLYFDSTYNPLNTVWSGNLSFDQSTVQAYGLYAQGSMQTYQFLTGNSLSGYTAPINALGGVGTYVGPALEGSATYDPPSLTNNTGAVTTVTVLGATLGDKPSASFSLDLQGIQLTAWVSSTNTVSVKFWNNSGGTLDLASGTLQVTDFKSSTAAPY